MVAFDEEEQHIKPDNEDITVVTQDSLDDDSCGDGEAELALKDFNEARRLRSESGQSHVLFRFYEPICLQIFPPCFSFQLAYELATRRADLAWVKANAEVRRKGEAANLSWEQYEEERTAKCFFPFALLSFMVVINLLNLARVPLSRMDVGGHTLLEACTVQSQDQSELTLLQRLLCTSFGDAEWENLVLDYILEWSHVLPIFLWFNVFHFERSHGAWYTGILIWAVGLGSIMLHPTLVPSFGTSGAGGLICFFVTGMLFADIAMNWDLLFTEKHPKCSGLLAAFGLTLELATPMIFVYTTEADDVNWAAIILLSVLFGFCCTAMTVKHDLSSGVLGRDTKWRHRGILCLRVASFLLASTVVISISTIICCNRCKQ